MQEENAGLLSTSLVEITLVEKSHYVVGQPEFSLTQHFHVQAARRLQ